MLNFTTINTATVLATNFANISVCFAGVRDVARELSKRLEPGKCHLKRHLRLHPWREDSDSYRLSCLSPLQPCLSQPIGMYGRGIGGCGTDRTSLG